MRKQPTPGNTELWNYSFDSGEVLGPVPANDVRVLISQGILQPHHQLLRVGTGEWMAVSESPFCPPPLPEVVAASNQPANFTPPTSESGVRWIFVNVTHPKAFEKEGPSCVIGENEACLLEDSSDGIGLVVRSSNGSGAFQLNGTNHSEPVILPREQEHALKIGRDLFLLKGGTSAGSWIEGLQVYQWEIRGTESSPIYATVPLAELRDTVQTLGLAPQTGSARVVGSERWISLDDLLPLAPRDSTASVSSPDPVDPEDEVEINTISGEFTCPHCWLHFDRGDVMWIAKHPSLRDPDLGDEFPLRFFPTNFDELGRAVDGMGVNCTAMACPNCKSRLPPQFMDLPSHIFSIVGAPSAGKSYFLTSMINQLEETLPTHFGLSFQDGDASANALLSNMRAKLFSDSQNPEDIALDKTVPGGEMFKTWERDGRSVKLPKPFAYLISPFAEDRGEEQSLNLIFYDNAGEQFEPAERSEAAESNDEDSTKHLANSGVIFFLYDPATNVKFRKKITGKEDPQLTDDKFLKLNRQDNIIAEMRIRIKDVLNLPANEKIATPLAILVGKCDLWMDLLDSPLENPITGRGLSLETATRNSDLIRNFLMATSPGVVGNAESISREVVYFPVSPIGHSPQTFLPTGGTEERIGPVPGKVDPLFVEVPVIWSLARLYPSLIKVNHAAIETSVVN